MQLSYAQNFEDVILWRALKHVKAGTYVDVGANDPLVDSVTRWFYDQGWSGLNIEPVPYWLDRLKHERSRDINVACAVAPRVGEMRFFDVVGTGLATLDPDIAERHRQDGLEVNELLVPSRPLDDLIEEHLPGRDIHFLKIDVEGAERAVLESIRFVNCRPWIVVVEATVPRSPELNHEQWEPLLRDKGYLFSYFDGLNRFYVAREHQHLQAALQTPPNAFDDFMRYSEWFARSELLRLQGSWYSPDRYQEALAIARASLEQVLAAEKAALEQALASTRQRIADMEASTSWRITQPLRRVRHLLASRRAQPPSPLQPPSESCMSLAAVTTAATPPQGDPPPGGALVSDVQSASPSPPDSNLVGAAHDLLYHQTQLHWRGIDHLEDLGNVATSHCCPLCKHSGPSDTFRIHQSQCRFGGGRLLRYQCPVCDVIFGPYKMLALTPEALGEEYEWHYRLFSEGDSTEQELRAFFALSPRRDGVYLNYGAGAWSRSVAQLREQGWNVIAYEPTASASSGPNIITSEAELRGQCFDGVFSNNVLEHLRHPAHTLRQLAALLKPGASMSHATPCFEYRYEYTRFHLFFFLGRSRERLAEDAGLEITHYLADGDFINYVMRPRAQQS